MSFVDAALLHQKDVEAPDQGQQVLRPAADLLGEEPIGVEELEAVGRQGVESLLMIEVVTAPQDEVERQGTGRGPVLRGPAVQRLLSRCGQGPRGDAPVGKRL